LATGLLWAAALERMLALMLRAVELRKVGVFVKVPSGSGLLIELEMDSMLG
jgi:hypothetical protein